MDGEVVEMPFVAPKYTAADFVITEDVVRLLTESNVESTDRNYRARVGMFQRWCADRGRVALPCTTATLIEYVGWMILGGVYDPNTVSAYHSTVVTWQERESTEHTRPGTMQTTKMIADFRKTRSATSAKKQSPTVLEPDLEKMLVHCDEDTRRGVGLRDAAMLSVGWHLLSRRIDLARLVPTSVVLHADGIAVRLVGHRSREDGSGFEAWIPARDDAPQLCPVHRMRAWLDYGRMIHMPMDQALFRALDKAGRLQVRLTPQTRPRHRDGRPKEDEISREDWLDLSYLSNETVTAIVKARAKLSFLSVLHLTEEQRAELGYNALLNEATAKAVTAQGIRVGGASALRAAYVPEDQIAEMADWQKDAAAMRRHFHKIRIRQLSPWAAARADRLDRQKT